jgi:tetratricopeptide (TPR) repeat protein
MDEAIEAFRSAVRAAGGLKAGDDELSVGKDAERAPVIARVPTHLRSDFATACFNLGESFRLTAQPQSAIHCYRMAIEANAKFLNAHTSLAVVLSELQRVDEAMASYRNAAALAPGAAATHVALGTIQLNNHHAEEAVESFRRAINAEPNSSSHWYDLQQALVSLGRAEEAEECAEKQRELRGDSVSTQSPGNSATLPSEFQRLSQVIQSPGSTIDQQIAAHFELGDLLDESGRYDDAFAHYVQANAMAKRQRTMAGQTYDPAAFRRLIDRTIELFTPEVFKQRREWDDSSDLPVFIVGMPRSGTTLVHQILASHPQIHGAGELNLLFQIETDFAGGPDSLGYAHWDREKIQQVSRVCLERFRAINPEALRIVDKLPSNVNRLGLIGLLMPRARVIICRRDARDTCLSCFFQNFSRGIHFSFDLADCASHYVQTDRLIAHWLKVKPVAMMEMHYETLVNDLETQSRRLIEFLGLPWNPACLEFHRASTAVLTASIRQVRRPVHQKSVGRWRHYQRHLGAMLEVLGKKSSDP